MKTIPVITTAARLWAGTNHTIRWGLWAALLVGLCRVTNLQAQTTINIPACANCPTATARGGLAPCPEAFVDIKTFGVQALGNRGQGVHGTNASVYNDMFLSTDGKILYDARGTYNDSLLRPNVWTYYSGSTAVNDERMGAVVPVEIVRQKFPGMTFKTFSHIDRTTDYAGEYLFLLNDQNDLYALILNPDGATGVSNSYDCDLYFPPLGPTLGSTPVPSRASALALWKKEVYRVVKITSPTLKFSSFWHNGPGGSTSINGVMYGYNPADELVYSWGANGSSPSPSSRLLRTASTLTQSLTPAPATIVNTILQRNGTSLKEMSDSLDTFLNAPYSSTNWVSTVFIGKDGNVYRYFPINGNNYKISLPNGVKAISVTSLDAFYILYVILGDDGKMYVDNVFSSDAISGSSAPAPSGLDVPITAVKYSTNAVQEGLFFTQIFQGGISGASQNNKYQTVVNGLTKTGKVYKCNSFVNTDPVDLTTTTSLPLFSKIYAALDYTSSGQDTKSHFIGRSLTTGNCIASVDEYRGAQGDKNSTRATSNGAPTTSDFSHFSDTGAFITDKFDYEYLWFNCYDPWKWKK